MIARILNTSVTLVVCLSLFGCGTEWEKKSVEVGFQGAASRQPYLAAGFLAEELGYPVERSSGLRPLPDPGWALLVHQDSLSSEETVNTLLDWVNEGGRLWISGLQDYPWKPGEMGDRKPELENSPSLEYTLEYLLDALEVRNGRTPTAPATLPSLGGIEVPWASERRLRQRKDYHEESLGNPRRSQLLRMYYGGGQIELFAGLSSFDNRNLRDSARAQLFEHLLAHPTPVTGMRIVQGHSEGFFAMLWRYAAPAIWLAILWMILWIIRGVRRFGPVEEHEAWDPDGEGIGKGREFVEHLTAAANHYRRQDQHELVSQAIVDQSGLDEASPARDGSGRWLARIQVIQANSHRKSLAGVRKGPSNKQPQSAEDKIHTSDHSRVEAN